MTVSPSYHTESPKVAQLVFFLHTCGTIARRNEILTALNTCATDIPEVLAIIKELANYEKASATVEATEERLAQTLCFAPSKAPSPLPSDQPSKDNKNSTITSKDADAGYPRALLVCPPSATSAETEDVAAMAVYYKTYSTRLALPGLFLEDLFVRPEFRRRGYGSLLVAALARETQSIGGGRLEWSCLEWNEDALTFYKKQVEAGGCGATRVEGLVGLRVERNGLRTLVERFE